MSARRVAALALALAMSAPAWPCAAADAADAPESAASLESHKAAQAAHRHGLQLFDQGQHEQALAEFRRAYTLSPSFRILYNVGLSCVALSDSRGALEAFAMYLRDGGERIPARRRAQVEAEIAKLSKQLAGLAIDVEEPSAELSVDGEVVGRAPLAVQLRLNAGRHTVVVRSPDGTLKTQRITLVAGDEQKLHFALTSSAGTAASEQTPPPGSAASPPSAAPSRRRPTPWLAWGVTGALGAATAVTGVLALGARGDEKDALSRRGVRSEELSSARSKVANLSLATDLLLVGTAVSAGVSLYLTLRPLPPGEASSAIVVAPGQITFRRSF